MQLTLAFTDNWQDVNGIDEYVTWALGPDGTHQDFYTSPAVAQVFQAHIRAVLERVNTVNGRRYMDDPTIFAW